MRRSPTGVGFVTGATMAATVTVILNAAGHATERVAVVTPLPQPVPVMLQLPPLDVATAALYLPALPLAPVVKPEPVVKPAPAVVEPVTVKAAGTTGGLAARAVTAALAMRGVPYSWGGTSRAGVDCSGLTQLAYRAAGVSLPRVAAAQATVGRSVKLADVQAGDLLYYDSPIGHVAMALGNGQLIEAPQPGQTVSTRPIYTSGLNVIKRVVG